MKAPFAPPYATMQEKIDKMYLHSKSIDDENESRSEAQQCSPMVDNKVLLAALDQRSGLLEALEELISLDVFKSGFTSLQDHGKLLKAKAAIAAARGTV